MKIFVDARAERNGSDSQFVQQLRYETTPSRRNTCDASHSATPLIPVKELCAPALSHVVAMLAPDPKQGLPSQMRHPPIQDAKDLMEPADRSGIGVILINSAGEVTVCNPHAEGIIAQADGLSLIKSRLCAAESSESEVLDRLIANAVGDGVNHHAPSGGVAIVHRHSLRQPFVLIVSRLTNTAGPIDDASHPRAAVLIKDPSDAVTSNAELLIDLFGLTRREAEVALAVVAGHGLRAAAQQLGIALTTARTHLQHVFEKTCTRRQNELTSLVLQILAFQRL